MGFLNGLKHFFTDSCPKCGADADYCSVIKEGKWERTPLITEMTHTGMRRFGGSLYKEITVKCKACGFQRDRIQKPPKDLRW